MNWTNELLGLGLMFALGVMAGAIFATCWILSRPHVHVDPVDEGEHD